MAGKHGKGTTPADTALLLHRRILALAIFLTLLTFLPLIARAGWREKTAETRIQGIQELSTNGDFAISFVPNGRQRNPAIACSPEGRCLSVWENSIEGNWRIYGQWVVNGELEGENFPISAALSNQYDPAIAYNNSKNEYLVSWWDDRDYVMSGYNIYGRLIAGNGEENPESKIQNPKSEDCPITTAPGDQGHPDITYNSANGEYLAVWQDIRHGDWDIFGRRISDNCTQLDNSFSISRVPGLQRHPAVAYDSIDNQYLTVWWDNRNWQITDEDIYGQVVSHDGTLLNDNFPISTAEGFQGYPDVACNSAGNEYLAAWADNRNSASTGFDIYGQRVSSQGELLDDEGNPGADPAVNSAISRAENDQKYPVLVYNSGLNQYLATWQDLRYANWDVFAQLVSGQGELLDKAGNPGADPAENFPISVAPNSQEHPALTYGRDEYLAVWQDNRHYDFVEEDIYGQWISSNVEFLGSSFPLVTTPISQTSPTAAYGGNPRNGVQNYLVVWEDARNSADTAYDIYGQIADITGTLQGINFPISTAASDQYFPAVASNTQDEFLVVWQDSREGNWDIYGQWVVNGELEGENFPISVAQGNQYYPAVAYNRSKDEYFVVWWDDRDWVITGYNIYGRLITDSREVGDSDCPIVTAAGDQQYPDITYNSANGEYMVIWQDHRNGNWDIYGRRISDQCPPLYDDFPVSQESARQWRPALAYNSADNQYLIVWWDNRNAATGWDIYGQRLASDGELLGIDLAISDAQGAQWSPDVAYSSFDNDYLVVWEDNRNSTSTAFDIYGQRVTRDGEMQGDNFPISAASDNQEHPALVYNDLEDQCLVVWEDRRNYDALRWEVYGEFLVDVAVSKEAPIKAPPGSNIAYTISYRNEGSTDAQNVMIADTLPPATTYISDTAPFSQTVVENTVVWEVGTLIGGASGQFTLVATVSPTATPGSILSNTIQISTSLSESDYSNNSAQTATKIPLWTFMAYLSGDNDLDPFMEEAFNNMEKAAQNPDVNILVLWDRCSLLSDDGRECLDKDEGIENTRLYRVEYDDSALITSPVQEVEWNPGELDMGDPDTLINFVTWARDNYPAKYYFLSILDHGGGWSPTFPEESEQELASLSSQDDQFIPLRRSYHAWGGTGLSWDFSDDYDYLSTAEMRRAFCSITMEGSAKMDVVFYDACLMGMIEEAYEIKDYVKYFIGSENEAWGSMPYDQYINSITSSTQPRELAVDVVNDYTASLPLTGHPSTISAVDLAAIKEVSLAVDSLAGAMIDDLASAGTVLQIRDAYLSAQKFDYDSDFRLEGETDGYVDLYHLASQIQENVTNTAILTAAQSVINALGSEDGTFVIAEQHRSGYPWMVTEPLEYWNLDNAHGISIYLPLGQDLQMTLENEEGATKTVKVRDWYADEQLSFAADTQWNEFITAYYTATSTPVPTSTLQGPREGIRPLQRRVYLPIVQ
jgi:uncharacterized repeat protein (TIGR01451 family)